MEGVDVREEFGAGVVPDVLGFEAVEAEVVEACCGVDLCACVCVRVSVRELM